MMSKYTHKDVRIFSSIKLGITHISQFHHKPPQHISLSSHKYMLKTPDNLAGQF